MPQTSGAPQLATLEDYLAAIRERKFVVLAFAVVLGLLAFFYADSRTDRYEAQATVVVGSTPVGSDANRLQTPNLERERSVIASELIANQVSASLAGDLDTAELLEELSVRYIPDSDVLSLTYISDDAEIAAERVNAFAAAYVEDREGQSVGYYEDQISLISDGIDSARLGVESLDALIEETLLEISRLDEVAATAAAPDSTGADLASAEAELASSRALRQEEAIVQRELERSLNTTLRTQAARPRAAQVLRVAAVPTSSLGISTAQLTVGGILVGLILGAIAAFFASRLDRSVRSDDGVSEVVAAPVLASIPQIRRRTMKSHSPIVMLSEAQDYMTRLAREEVRRLRSAAAFSLIKRSASVIVVTSSKPGEGKSTVAANLAVAIAQSGQRTALVSADLRRPTVEVLFALDGASRGLTDWLAGDDSVAIGTASGVDRLTLIESGPEPSNPAELLGSTRAEYFFAELRTSFDVVIIDSPPVLAAADVFALVQHADEVLLVVNDRKTELDELGEAVSRLSQLEAKILGVVRNGTKPGLRALRGDAYSYSSRDDRPKLIEMPEQASTLVDSSS